MLDDDCRRLPTKVAEFGICRPDVPDLKENEVDVGGKNMSRPRLDDDGRRRSPTTKPTTESKAYLF